MQFSIQRNALVTAMATAVRVVERRNTIPILSNALLTADNGGLRIKATDLDIETTVTTACEEIATEGAITVPAYMLADIAKKLPDGATIKCTLDAEADTLTLQSSRSRFRIQTLPASDFPDIAAGEFSHRFTLSGRDLGRLIAKSEFAISTEETRYYLNGIYLHVADVEGKEMLTAVATDGHRLARIRTPCPDGASGMPGIIVPRKAVAELARLAKDAEKGEITLEVSEAKIRATTGTGIVFTSKLIYGTFPDYTRVIPAGNDKRAVLDAEEFARAVDRVSAIASERGRAVKLTFDAGLLELDVNNPDSGAAHEEIEFTATQDFTLMIGFNATYVATIVATLGVERIALCLDDPGSPSLWEEAREDEDPTQPNALYVLMPMRV